MIRVVMMKLELYKWTNISFIIILSWFKIKEITWRHD